MPASPSQPPRIYLAGPDVFLQSSAAVFARLKAQCAALGLVGLEPSDGGLAAGFRGSDEALAQRIYDGNIALIRAADGVLANLSAFRGLEPDPGTVFEVGYAVALGKPVAAYGVPPTSYAERVAGQTDCAPDAQGVLREVANGTMVEGLGQRLNLMLTRSAALTDSPEAALQRLAARLRAGAGDRPQPTLRRFALGDEPALHRVFHTAVHQTAARDYSPEQLAAWAPEDMDLAAFAQQLRSHRPFVALLGQEIVGYADLQADGFIAHFFVAGAHSGRGVGTLLMARLHEEARALGLQQLWANVSRTAEGFFARHGFTLEERRAPVRRGVTLHNARMRKRLVADLTNT